jgi:hypothetical protein
VISHGVPGGKKRFKNKDLRFALKVLGEKPPLSAWAAGRDAHPPEPGMGAGMPLAPHDMVH